MKRFVSLGIFLMLILCGMAQQDSILYAQEPDSLSSPEKTARNWIPFSIGGYWADGGSNYFDGYSYEVLRTNIQVGTLGFPIHNDWMFFTPFSTQPQYFETGGFFQLADTNLNLRLRFAGAYSKTQDSMFYQGGFTVDDTVFRRTGSELTHRVSVGVTLMKTSRNFGKFFRFYAGGMGEVFGAIGSKIDYSEFAYDIGEEREVQRENYTFNGKPRLNLYASAVAGAELTFFKRVGVFGEFHSGIGMQVKVGEKPVGIAKTLYMVGVQYYLVPNIGNVRKKAPEPLEPKEKRFRGPEKRQKKEKVEE